MSAYVTVDQVAARFPKFERAGAFADINAIARAGGIVTATLAAAPTGAIAGWNVVIYGVTGGATAFNGTFQIASVNAAVITFAQAGADEAGAGGQASVSRPGAVSDGQIQNWIDETSEYIEALAQSRGYDLTNLPAATATDAQTMLRNLNKLAAQVLLGEVLESKMALTGPWALLTGIRAESQLLQKNFGAGMYDKLFYASAKTQDAAPQLGGYVPGFGVQPPTCAKFTKDQVL